MTTGRNLEMLACFDDNGNRVEPHTRGEVHAQPLQFWHAVTNIWVINSQGQILCTHRSSINEGNPNKWQTYVGGHVKHEDDFEGAAIRELGEEIGLSLTDGNLVYVKEEKGEPWKHIGVMFAFFWDGNVEDINAQDGEIDDAKWMSFEDYAMEKESYPEEWCNNIDKDRYEEIIKLKN